MQSQHVPVYKNIRTFVYLEFQKLKKKGFSDYQKEVVIECS